MTFRRTRDIARHGREQIRVCAPIQSFPPVVGGAQVQLQRLLPHFAARGVTTTVLTRGVPGHSRTEPLQHGSIRRTRVPGRSGLASADFILEGAAHIARNRTRYDLVHAHGALSEGAIALVGSALGLPVLVKILRTGVHGDINDLQRRPAGRARLKLLLQRAWFVAVSDETREELEGLGAPPERIFDVPNGVDETTYRPATGEEKLRLRRQLGLGAGPVAIFTGRLDDVKRLDVVLSTLPGVPGVDLLLVGDGPDRERLSRIVRDNGVADRVRFTGKVTDVADYLRASDVFVTPSDAEGLSNALMEAMACGLACLAAPASGVAQLLGADRGVVVGDGGWLEALRAVLEDPERHAALGGRASRHVRENLTLATTADRLTAVYDSLLDAETA